MLANVEEANKLKSGSQKAVQTIIAEWKVNLKQFKGEFFETQVSCFVLCLFSKFINSTRSVQVFSHEHSKNFTTSANLHHWAQLMSKYYNYDVGISITYLDCVIDMFVLLFLCICSAQAAKNKVTKIGNKAGSKLGFALWSIASPTLYCVIYMFSIVICCMCL